MTVGIESLAQDDIDAVCELARSIWRVHYPPIIGREQTEYMLAQRYRPELVREELARDVWWDVVKENGIMRAFASAYPVCSAGALKLDKLYVAIDAQRRGFGRLLVEHICERAKRAGYATVELAVNRHNVNAINAYGKYGFDVVRTRVKDIGAGFVMDDYIMARAL